MGKVIKYIFAVCSGLFMFLASSLLAGLVFMFVLPRNFWEIKIHLGLLDANLPSLISFFIGSIVGTMSFKASFNAKTGRLYIFRKQPPK
jgi:uncharacterized membrane protein